MGWFDSIPAKYRAIAALVTAFLVGGLVAVTLMGFVRLPDRVLMLEHRFEAHVDTVSVPGMARIRKLEQQVEAIPEIRAMVFQMWCSDFPDECDSVPRAGGASP